jgi:hypothetical protein
MVLEESVILYQNHQFTKEKVTQIPLILIKCFNGSKEESRLETNHAYFFSKWAFFIEIIIIVSYNVI